MTNVKEVHCIDGGYVVEFDDGYVAEVCAYEQAEEAADRWCDEHHVTPNGTWLVNGWEAADELLADWGYAVETIYW